MQIIEAIGVRVYPEMKGFRASLESDLKKIDTDLKVDLRVNVDVRLADLQLKLLKSQWDGTVLRPKVNLNMDQTAQAFHSLAKLDIGKLTQGLDLKTAEKDTDRLNLSLLSLGRSALSSGASIGATTLKIGALGGAAAATVGSLSSVAGGLASIAPAALILPGAITAAGLAFATAKVGLSGFGDALKNMGDPEKFAESLKDLAPAAQETARAVAGLKGPFMDLRNAVQQEMFAGMAKTIERLGKSYIPLLRAGMTDLAKTFNQVGVNLGGFLNASGTIRDVRAAFADTNVAMRNVSAGINPILFGLRDIGAVGVSLLPELTEGFGQAAESFRVWAENARASGQLKDMMREAFATIGQVVDILGNLGSIVASIFKAADTAGVSFLDMLQDLTGEFSEFLKTSGGVQILTDIFGALRSIIDGLKPVLGEIVESVVQDLLPAILDLAPVIGAAFASLAPAIEPLGRAIAAMGPVVGALATALANVLVPTIQALGPVVETLAPVVAELATFLGEVLVTAIVAATPIVQALAEILSSVLQSALEALRPVLPVIADALRLLGETIGSVLRDAAPVLAEVAGILIGAFAEGIAAVAPYIPDLALAFGDLVRAVLPLLPSLAQLAAELLPSILGILPEIIPAMIDMVRAWTDIMNAVVPLVPVLVDSLLPAFREIVSVVGNVIKAVAEMAAGIAEHVGGMVDVVVGLLTGDFGQAWEGAKSMVSGSLRFIGGLLSGVFELLAAPFKIAINAVLGIFRNAGVDWGSALRGVVQSLPNAIGNIGMLLFNAGKSLIQGFIDGIRNMAANAMNAVSGLVGKVRDFFPFSPAKRGPFSGNGYTLYSGRALAEDFALGITQRSDRAVTAIEHLMAAANTTMASGLSTADLTAQVNRSMNVDIGGAADRVADAVESGLANAEFTIDPNGVFRVNQKAGIAFQRR